MRLGLEDLTVLPVQRPGPDGGAPEHCCLRFLLAGRPAKQYTLLSGVGVVTCPGQVVAL